MNKGIIYKYTSPSNKVYIGLTIDESHRRCKFLHLNYDYAGAYINNARKKYGPENFKYEVLIRLEMKDTVELKNKLNELEMYYIKQYKSNNKKFGYNLNEGGNGEGHKHTEETKLKMTITRSTSEVKKKMSEAHNKGVCQYSKTGEFIAEYKSITLAATITNIAATSIGNCCHNTQKTAGGFIWAFKGCKPLIIKDERLRSILQYTKDNTLLREWSSSLEIANTLGFDKSGICNVCRGNRQTYKGFIWKYKEDKEVFNNDNVEEKEV